MPAFGTAKTNSFMLGEASILIGPQADLRKLNPDDHLLGMVKNFAATNDTGYVELTQGVQNTVVHSTKNRSALRATFEVYEYTSRNIAFSLGLDGADFSTQTVSTALAASVSGSKTTPDTSIDLTSATGFAEGDLILVIGPDDDQIFVDIISGLTGTVATLTYGIPDNLASGTVKLANDISLASMEAEPFLACVALGNLADGQPVRIEMPKVRITKGFSMNFQTGNYGNLPFELTIYQPVAADPIFTGFETRAARLLTTA